MAAINLESGKVYSVKVTNIEVLKTRPSFEIKNKTFYNFVIHIEVKDKEAKSGWVEYNSQDPDINAVPFEIGIVQFVKCRECTERHCVIDPYDPEPQASNFDEKVEMARRLADPNYKHTQPAPRPTPAPQPNLYGNSLTMFVSYAKDLKIAELEARSRHISANFKITENDLEEMWHWALYFQDKAVKRLSEG